MQRATRFTLIGRATYFAAALPHAQPQYHASRQLHADDTSTVPLAMTRTHFWAAIPFIADAAGWPTNFRLTFLAKHCRCFDKILLRDEALHAWRLLN